MSLVCCAWPEKSCPQKRPHAWHVLPCAVPAVRTPGSLCCGARPHVPVLPLSRLLCPGAAAGGVSAAGRSCSPCCAGAKGGIGAPAAQRVVSCGGFVTWADSEPIVLLVSERWGLRYSFTFY